MKRLTLRKWLDPRLVFLTMAGVSFLSWIVWDPLLAETQRYISVHSFYIVILAGLFLLVGIGIPNRFRKYNLIIDYRIFKIIFFIFFIVSMLATWKFILNPFFSYGFTGFFGKILHFLQTKQITGARKYYLAPGIGVPLGFLSWRWMLLPTLAMLQELKITKHIATRAYYFLTLSLMTTGFLYTMLIGSRVLLATMLLIPLVIVNWKKRMKFSRILVVVVALFLLLSIVQTLRMGGTYKSANITLFSLLEFGKRHLVLYYGSSLNYGFYLIDNYRNYLTFPVHTFGYIYGAFNIGTRDTYHALSSTPVFAGGLTTLSGYGNLATEYGEALIPVMFLVGIFIGFIYFNGEHNVFCRSLYPFVLVGLLEFPRYFYFTGSPFIVPLFAILLAVVISNPRLKLAQ